MKILFIGDIVGRIGRKTVTGLLPQIKSQYAIDFVVANSENATHGHGISHAHYEELSKAGVDAFTSGNHFTRHKDAFNSSYDFSKLVRPYNLHSKTPLEGTRVFTCNGKSIRITNLLGRIYIDPNVANPFDSLLEIIETKEKADIHIVDFHAEATGEKMSLAWAFDGQVNAVLGTHTHIQTADERLLPNGTAFIADVGMCGAYNSVIGDSVEPVVKRTWTGLPAVFTIPDSGPTLFSAIVLTIDDATNKTTDIERIRLVK